MTVDEALAILDRALQSKQLGHLNDVQEMVFRQCWEGHTYAEIAEASSYDTGYIKDLGSKLWKLVSDALTEKVTKNNIQSVMRRHTSMPEPVTVEAPAAIAPAVANSAKSTVRVDWGEAVDVSAFYGRSQELTTLKRWILEDGCRLLLLLGMGGIGKTSLSVRLIEELIHPDAIALQINPFQHVIWRSLRNAPPLDGLLAELIRFLSDERETEVDLPSGVEVRINRVLHYLQAGRCFLVLDNAETILQEGQAGLFREGYEAYGVLLRRIGETRMQSCVMLTSREKPRELVPLEGDDLPVRSLLVKGLTGSEGQEVLRHKGALMGSEQDWQTLIDSYAGNPLALKMVATTINELFDGSITEFLQQGTAIFDDVRALLDQQFGRLTHLEKKVMLWLAIAREPTPIQELQEDIVPAVTRAQLMEAVGSLGRRSLIEKHGASYTQQPVVMEYLTQQLVDQMFSEINTQQIEQFTDYALIKAQAKDHVRESQTRLILGAIADRLTAVYRSKLEIANHLNQMVDILRDRFSARSGYATGNVINLLNYLQVDLSGYDFSQLAVWQAYLQDVALHEVNLSHTNLAKSVFAQTLGSILSVAFSPDGKLLAASDAEGRIRWWQVSDGRQLFACKEHPSWVWSVTFSPDSRQLASCGEDGIIRLWDTTTQQCLQELAGHTHWVRKAVFSPNGQLLVSASEDQTLGVWEVESGTLLQTLSGHTAGICDVVFSPDGQWVASSSVDQTIRLWQVNETDAIAVQVLTGHRRRIWAIAFSPDSQLLASGGDDQTVNLWEVGTGQLIKTLNLPSRIWSLAFSPQQLLLAIASDDQTIRLWQPRSGDLRTLYGHTNRVWSVAFNPDGQLLASGSDDQTIRFWEVTTGQQLRTFQGHHNWVWSVAFSPDGAWIASGGEDRQVRLWHARTGRCQNALSGHSGRIWSVAFSPDAAWVASGSDDHQVKLWDRATGRCRKTLRGHTRQVRQVCFSPDGLRLASASGDQTVRIWDVSTGQCLQILQGHTSWVFAAAFSPDGDYLATSSDDQTVRIWEMDRGECVQVLKGHDRPIQTVAFSPNGKHVISGSDDQTVRLWDATMGDCLYTWQGHTGQILAVDCTQDGDLCASASSDRTIKLWNTRTGECLQTLAGHTNLVWAIAFHPDGTTLVSGSEDETIKLWNLADGKCRKTLSVKRIYEGMDITAATGLTDAQRETLQALGAIAEESR